MDIHFTINFSVCCVGVRERGVSLDQLTPEMATISHTSDTIIPQLTLIAVIAKKPVVMVATRWFCVSTSIRTCLQCLDPADKSLVIWSAGRLLRHRLGFHREGPRNQKWSSGGFWLT